MHRFFVARDSIEDDRLAITGGDARHIQSVLRLQAGDEIHVHDGEGVRYRVRLLTVGRREVTGLVVAQEPHDTESPLGVHLGQSLLKGQAMDGVVRRAVELGAASITPLITARCQVPKQAEKCARWQEIARSAARQSGRSRVPPVNEALPLEAFLAARKDDGLKLMFYEGEGAARIPEPANPPVSAALVIGPEGGFEAAEVALAGRYGFQVAGLGPRILRADTAPLVALALVQGRFGDL